MFLNLEKPEGPVIEPFSGFPSFRQQKSRGNEKSESIEIIEARLKSHFQRGIEAFESNLVAAANSFEKAHNDKFVREELKRERNRPEARAQPRTLESAMGGTPQHQGKRRRGALSEDQESTAANGTADIIKIGILSLAAHWNALLTLKNFDGAMALYPTLLSASEHGHRVFDEGTLHNLGPKQGDVLKACLHGSGAYLSMALSESRRLFMWMVKRRTAMDAEANAEGEAHSSEKIVFSRAIFDMMLAAMRLSGNFPLQMRLKKFAEQHLLLIGQALEEETLISETIRKKEEEEERATRERIARYYKALQRGDAEGVEGGIPFRLSSKLSVVDAVRSLASYLVSSEYCNRETAAYVEALDDDSLVAKRPGEDVDAASSTADAATMLSPPTTETATAMEVDEPDLSQKEGDLSQSVDSRAEGTERRASSKRKGRQEPERSTKWSLRSAHPKSTEEKMAAISQDQFSVLKEVCSSIIGGEVLERAKANAVEKQQKEHSGMFLKRILAEQLPVEVAYTQCLAFLGCDDGTAPAKSFSTTECCRIASLGALLADDEDSRRRALLTTAEAAIEAIASVCSHLSSTSTRTTTKKKRKHECGHVWLFTSPSSVPIDSPETVALQNQDKPVATPRLVAEKVPITSKKALATLSQIMHEAFASGKELFDPTRAEGTLSERRERVRWLWLWCRLSECLRSLKTTAVVAGDAETSKTAEGARSTTTDAAETNDSTESAAKDFLSSRLLFLVGASLKNIFRSNTTANVAQRLSRELTEIENDYPSESLVVIPLSGMGLTPTVVRARMCGEDQISVSSLYAYFLTQKQALSYFQKEAEPPSFVVKPEKFLTSAEKEKANAYLQAVGVSRLFAERAAAAALASLVSPKGGASLTDTVRGLAREINKADSRVSVLSSALDVLCRKHDWDRTEDDGDTQLFTAVAVMALSVCLLEEIQNQADGAVTYWKSSNWKRATEACAKSLRGIFELSLSLYDSNYHMERKENVSYRPVFEVLLSAPSLALRAAAERALQVSLVAAKHLAGQLEVDLAEQNILLVLEILLRSAFLSSSKQKHASSPESTDRKDGVTVRSVLSFATGLPSEEAMNPLLTVMDILMKFVAKREKSTTNYSVFCASLCEVADRCLDPTADVTLEDFDASESLDEESHAEEESDSSAAPQSSPAGSRRRRVGLNVEVSPVGVDVEEQEKKVAATATEPASDAVESAMTMFARAFSNAFGTDMGPRSLPVKGVAGDVEKVPVPLSNTPWRPFTVADFVAYSEKLESRAQKQDSASVKQEAVPLSKGAGRGQKKVEEAIGVYLHVPRLAFNVGVSFADRPLSAARVAFRAVRVLSPPPMTTKKPFKSGARQYRAIGLMLEAKDASKVHKSSHPEATGRELAQQLREFMSGEERSFEEDPLPFFPGKRGQESEESCVVLPKETYDEFVELKDLRSVSRAGRLYHEEIVLKLAKSSDSTQVLAEIIKQQEQISRSFANAAALSPRSLAAWFYWGAVEVDLYFVVLNVNYTNQANWMETEDVLSPSTLERWFSSETTTSSTLYDDVRAITSYVFTGEAMSSLDDVHLERGIRLLTATSLAVAADEEAESDDSESEQSKKDEGKLTRPGLLSFQRLSFLYAYLRRMIARYSRYARERHVLLRGRGDLKSPEGLARESLRNSLSLLVESAKYRSTTGVRWGAYGSGLALWKLAKDVAEPQDARELFSAIENLAQLKEKTEDEWLEGHLEAVKDAVKQLSERPSSQRLARKFLAVVFLFLSVHNTTGQDLEIVRQFGRKAVRLSFELLRWSEVEESSSLEVLQSVMRGLAAVSVTPSFHGVKKNSYIPPAEPAIEDALSIVTRRSSSAFVSLQPFFSLLTVGVRTLAKCIDALHLTTADGRATTSLGLSLLELSWYADRQWSNEDASALWDVAKGVVTKIVFRSGSKPNNFWREVSSLPGVITDWKNDDICSKGILLLIALAERNIDAYFLERATCFLQGNTCGAALLLNVVTRLCGSCKKVFECGREENRSLAAVIGMNVAAAARRVRDQLGESIERSREWAKITGTLERLAESAGLSPTATATTTATGAKANKSTVLDPTFWSSAKGVKGKRERAHRERSSSQAEEKDSLSRQPSQQLSQQPSQQLSQQPSQQLSQQPSQQLSQQHEIGEEVEEEREQQQGRAAFEQKHD